MTTRIQLRRGNASSWTSANPVLALGEAGIETDTLTWKVGDGTTAWANLDYMSGGGGNVTYGNSNVAAFMAAFGSNTVSTTGNTTSGNVNTSGAVSATGNVTGNYFIGNGSQLTGINAGSSSKIFNGTSYANIATANGNVAISANGAGWTFDTAGEINIPADSSSFGTGHIQSANGYPTLLGYGSGEHGGPELDWTDGNDPTDIGNASVLRNTLYINDGGLYVGINENEVANVASPSWRFNPNGTTIFPTLEVDLHNGGVQTGQVLQFGDAGQQAIITGPTPAANNSAQRLIIQGQRGNGTGEGGDVYLWAGDAENNGGDIKIYAGDADAGNVGDLGGYVNIDGGSGYTRGGQVEITGGYSSSGDGGYVNLIGGYGRTGGDANVSGGFGATGPGGDVSIIGGASANGQAEYGNVIVATGSKNWTFNNTGSLVLPNGAGIKDTSGDSVAFGQNAGANNQSQHSVAIGLNAGQTNQGEDSVAIGWNAGYNTQGNAAVAVGEDAGYLQQGEYSIAIGRTAGYYQQANNSIVLNATGTQLDVSTANTFVVKPIRSATTGNVLYYDESTGEITFDVGGSGGLPLANGTSNINIATANSNVTITANAESTWTFDTAGNLTLPAGGNLTTSGNVGANVFTNTYDNDVNISARPGQNGNIYLHPDGSGQIIMGGAAPTLLFLQSDSPNTQNKITVYTYGNGLGSFGGGTFVGQYNRLDSASLANDRLAAFTGSGTEDGGNVTQYSSGKITIDAASNWSVGNTPTHISFWTTPFNSNTSIETVRVDASGNISMIANGSINGANVVTANVVVTVPTALANLTAVAGGRAFVNNGNLAAVGNFGAQIGSGGSNTVPVWSDGSNWYIG